jgi:hypothetical protein
MGWSEDRIQRQNQQQLRVQCSSEIPRPAGEGAGFGMTPKFRLGRAGVPAPHGLSPDNLLHFVPWIMGVAEDWDASRVRGRFSPKKLGEMSQAAFLLKAQSLGFGLAVPWGDSEKCDFIVWAGGGGRLYRVQVKGTGRLHRGGYDVQPVYATRGEGKKSYTAEEIDVLAARVVIEGSGREVWYLLPASVVEGVKNLRLFPELKGKNPRWEGYREAWEWLGG